MALWSCTLLVVSVSGAMIQDFLLHRFHEMTVPIDLESGTYLLVRVLICMMVAFRQDARGFCVMFR